MAIWQLSRSLLTRLSREEAAATAVEYGLLVALIAAVIIATVIILGGVILDSFADFNSDFSSATS